MDPGSIPRCTAGDIRSFIGAIGVRGLGEGIRAQRVWGLGASFIGLGAQGLGFRVQGLGGGKFAGLWVKVRAQGV